VSTATKAPPVCRREGCEEPRYVQPGGQRRPDCAAHYRETKREHDRRYREKNAEAIRESNRRYREENAEAIREAKRRYREANPEAIRESNRRYREEDPEAGRERRRLYQARYAARTDAEIEEAQARLRPDGTKRCRKCGETLPLTAFFSNRARADGLANECHACQGSSEYRSALPWWLAIGVDPALCVYCGGEATHGEHVFARRFGGPDTPLQMVPSCGPCNYSKHAAKVHEWRQRKFPVIRFAPLVEIVREWLWRKGYLLPDADAERLWREIAAGQGWTVPVASGEVRRP
jgi:hypothetical protein